MSVTPVNTVHTLCLGLVFSHCRDGEPLPMRSINGGMAGGQHQHLAAVSQSTWVVSLGRFVV